MATPSIAARFAQRPLRRPPRPRSDEVISTLQKQGYIQGSDVLIGGLPGVIVGYNLGAISRFIDGGEPLVVRTARGIACCRTDDIALV